MSRFWVRMSLMSSKRTRLAHAECRYDYSDDFLLYGGLGDVCEKSDDVVFSGSNQLRYWNSWQR